LSREPSDFRFHFGDKVRYNGTARFTMPAGTEGVVVRLNMQGDYPYRVVFDDEDNPNAKFGYMMRDEELE
jgi:hypothetical protein